MSNDLTGGTDGSSSQDKACRAVAEYLHRLLSHATTVDGELQRSKASSYPISNHVVRSNCRVLLWMLGPVIPREGADPSALAGYGVEPATLASFFATQGREADLLRAFRWLADLSKKLGNADSRPGNELLDAWQDATALLRKAVAETVGRDLPKLTGKLEAADDDFADVEGLPAEIAFILKRGDFPILSDDERAKLGAWLSANTGKVYCGPDPAKVAKTRRMEEAKKRLRAIFGYNSALRQPAAPAGNAPAAAQDGQEGQGGKPPAEAGKAKAAERTKPEAHWRDVQERLLRLYDAGEAYTSQDDLAKRMRMGMRTKCSKATINKAIKDSRRLTGWMKRALDAKRSPKAQGLNEKVLGQTPSTSEDDPADYLPDEDVDHHMARLIQEAQPEERAKLNELNKEERQDTVKAYLAQKAAKHIEDDATGGNRPLGRKA